MEYKVEEVRPMGQERVLARVSLVGEGRGSGVNLEGEVFYCFWLRHGRIFRQEDHLTLGGAMRAFGLGGE